MGNKRIGIEFSEELWRESRKKCLDKGVTFSDYIRDLVKKRYLYR